MESKLAYHYRVNGFCPRTDIDLSRWGFSIDLDFKFGSRLAQMSLPADVKQNLQEDTERIQQTICQDKDRRRPTFQFWDDTYLLTNITVEPGNACGLDMEYSDFKAAKEGRGHAYSKLTYLPHNVDSMRQAAAILAVWTMWYNGVEAMIAIEDEKK